MNGKTLAVAVLAVLACLPFVACKQPTTDAGLQVNSSPTGAEIWLDGVNTGRTTNYLFSVVQPGDHVVRLRLDAHYVWQDTVSVTAGQTATVNATLLADSGLVLLGTNAQGFEEYLWLRDSSVMVKIPAGSFTMGDSINADETPVHTVYLSLYYVDKYEVTNRQYRHFCDSTGYPRPMDPGFSSMPHYFDSFPDYPVVNVSWDDADTFCSWAGKVLVTEAQWEKAARGTDGREYPWGNFSPDSTTCNWGGGDSFPCTSRVGAFPAGHSPYGVADMAGNVWEWCNDLYDSDYYSVSPDSNPTGPTTGTDRVARGGSYNNTSVWLRCAERYWGPQSSGDHPALGFRCALAKP